MRSLSAPRGRGPKVVGPTPEAGPRLVNPSEVALANVTSRSPAQARRARLPMEISVGLWPARRSAAKMRCDQDIPWSRPDLDRWLLPCNVVGAVRAGTTDSP